MVRTRVGYAGGRSANPTYYSLGDHSETIQIDYDPSQISYEQLLDVFWRNHNPTLRPWSQQYASIVFYHDEEQKRLAEQSQERQAASLGRTIYTEIRPAGAFYLAEDYHQKYRLRQTPALLREFQAIYPNVTDLINSTAAARVNGYVAGYGTLAGLQAELDDLGLTTEGRQRLLETVQLFDR